MVGPAFILLPSWQQEDQKLKFLDAVCTICTTSSKHSFLWGTLLLLKPELAESLEVLLQEEPVDRLDTTVRQQVMLTIAAMSRAELLLEDKNSLLEACFCSIFQLPPQDSQGPGAWLYDKVCHGVSHRELPVPRPLPGKSRATAALLPQAARAALETLLPCRPCLRWTACYRCWCAAPEPSVPSFRRQRRQRWPPPALRRATARYCPLCVTRRALQTGLYSRGPGPWAWEHTGGAGPVLRGGAYRRESGSALTGRCPWRVNAVVTRVTPRAAVRRTPGRGGRAAAAVGDGPGPGPGPGPLRPALPARLQPVGAAGGVAWPRVDSGVGVPRAAAAWRLRRAAGGPRPRAGRQGGGGRGLRCVLQVTGAEGRPRAAGGRPVDEEVSSDSETECLLQERRRREAVEAEEEVEETPQEKKLRLAKLYLEQLRQHEEELAEEEEETQQADLIGERLKEDVLEQKGRLQRLVAKDVQPPDPASIRVLRGHQLPVTCVVISPDDRFIFSASKDGSLIKCKCSLEAVTGSSHSSRAIGAHRGGLALAPSVDVHMYVFGLCERLPWGDDDALPAGEVESGKKLCVVPGGKKGTEKQHMGHASHILCMAISSDGKYLATGDRNKLIMIWDTATCKRLHIFTGHRDAVSGLAFRKGTHQLYSASHDRCVKVWNVAENAYVETLFGHQDVITGLDSLSRECCVTAGGRDGTVRLWKIPEESQLVFCGHQGSIDCIQLINEEHMVSGADDGSVALWGVTKKKPLALARQAHGMQDAQGLQQPYWISAVAALRNSDLLATGSHSTSVKLWKCSEGFRKLEPLWDIPLVGFVNSLKFSAAGDFLVAGIGQEHRLGRWWRIKGAKNSVCIIPLKQRATVPSLEGPDSS
ncbi:U3 small nucleolar RNA-interacting protein 2 [Neopsephotus bourkii]|uniref:U3 small nucleolar RNA-interacting protein 2 n=1 Tax=Neopsephotus bourkii TaxID=309878 RepID=UPI002AA57C8C|nr:U3 small nucleolar RNA-interacting protein 2 [Neopsephotus bourkii]